MCQLQSINWNTGNNIHITIDHTLIIIIIIII
jgi:hypothetical protein